jgi:hypothetical protein
VKKLYLGILAAGALVFTPSIHAYLEFDFGNYKQFRQTDLNTVGFDLGTLRFQLEDGQAYYVGCDGNAGPAKETPNLACPLGTTGFFASGDLNGDGIRDASGYYSISNIVRATVIAPFLPARCAMVAAPPCTLPRPLTPVLDAGWIVFYNVLTPTVKEYDATGYLFSRPYAAGSGELSRMNKEVVTGTYYFSFPLLAKPTQSAVITGTIHQFVEGYGKASTGIVSGFRITNGNWFQGNYEMDPRVVQTIKWTGNNSQNISPGVDSLYFSMRSSTDETLILFPGPGQITTTTGSTSSAADNLTQLLLLSNSMVTSYTMPPKFFSVGGKGTLSIDIVRSLASSSVSFDNSHRSFRAGVSFVDSYAGFAQETIPSTYPSIFPVVSKRGMAVTTAQAAASGDYDGDGVSNLIEFAFGSDPTDPTSKPTEPLEKATTFIGGGYVQRIIPKRPYTGSTLTYNYDVKVGPIWVRITPGVGWKITEPTDKFGAYSASGGYVTIRSTTPWATAPIIRVTPVYNPLPTT